MAREFKLCLYGKTLATLKAKEDIDPMEAMEKMLWAILEKRLEMEEVMADDRQGEASTDRGVSGGTAVIPGG